MLIATSILILLWGTVKQIGRRLIDGIDPHLLDKAEHALAHTTGVTSVQTLQLRWIGHRLTGAATIETDALTLHEAGHVAENAGQRVRGALRNLDSFTVTPVPAHDRD